MEETSSTTLICSSVVFALRKKAKGKILIREPFPLSYSDSPPHSMGDKPDFILIIALETAFPISKTLSYGVIYPVSAKSMNIRESLSYDSPSIIDSTKQSIMEESSDQVPNG